MTMYKSRKEPLLILASKSPRRRYLLEQAGISFTVVPSNIDETTVAISSPEIHVKLLSEAKAKAVSEQYPENWVVGADTIVVKNGNVLGKPSSKKNARKMLRTLSGQVHKVFTGYTICCKNKEKIFSETTKTDVLFKELNDDEIKWYINTEEPFDKAGAYAIQGLGSFLVKSINGSYTNVVGLPVCEVIEYLIKEKVMNFNRK